AVVALVRLESAGDMTPVPGRPARPWRRVRPPGSRRQRALVLTAAARVAWAQPEMSPPGSPPGRDGNSARPRPRRAASARRWAARPAARPVRRHPAPPTLAAEAALRLAAAR
ncbi:MAG: hypothetical protein U5R31_06140, partial [Acidimicrobiia bacterium]|nr:hypothetical protein [Acidimicrobiia bacterium]